MGLFLVYFIKMRPAFIEGINSGFAFYVYKTLEMR